MSGGGGGGAGGGGQREWYCFFDHHIDKVEKYRQCHSTASVKLALKVSSYLPSQLSFIIVLYLNVYLCIF